MVFNGSEDNYVDVKPSIDFTSIGLRIPRTSNYRSTGYSYLKLLKSEGDATELGWWAYTAATATLIVYEGF